MSSTFRSTENWSHFVFWREKKQEELKHAHDSCKYCNELVVKPDDDLMGGPYISAAPGDPLSLKGELCSQVVPSEGNLRCKSQREQSVKMLTCPKITWLFFFLNIWLTPYFILQSFPFQTELVLHPFCRMQALLCLHQELHWHTGTTDLDTTGRTLWTPVSFKHLFSQC